jgi:sugar transferase (PEP-CTERM/EpsH1 system associated)
MKILFVCHRLPYPPNRGGKIRPFHMIEHLSRRHSVVVASLAHTEEELREGQPLKGHCEDVIAEVLPGRARWLQAAAALPTATPSSVAYFYSRRLASRIRQAWRRENFGAIIVHCAFAAQYVRGLHCGLRMLDFGDVDSVKWMDYSQHRSLPLSAGYRFEALKLRSFERQMTQEFDICTATTCGELDEVRRLNAAKAAAVIPNGVDLTYFCPRPKNPQNSSVIAFLGRMDYYPNIDGVLFFAAEIFPLVRQSVPDAQFRIIGSNPSRAVRDLAKIAGISVTGHVADVRPHLADAALAVAPLRIARGTQNKILQFLAMGIPVLSTTPAAKGVQVQPGKHLLIADEPKTFAGEVVRLLGDAELREQLSLLGRQPLATAHSWPHSMKLLDELLERHARGSSPRISLASSDTPA